MKLLLALTLIGGMATTLFAQDASVQTSSPTPLPPGPLVKPFPSQIRWIIMRKDEGGASQTASPAPSQAASPAASPAASQAAPQKTPDIQIVGEKVGDISHTISTYVGGTKMEVWKTRGQEVTVRTGGRVPIVSQSTPDAAEDLGWIGASNFKGIQGVSGIKCMIFRAKIVPANMVGAVRLAQMAREQYNNSLKAGTQNPLFDSWRDKPENLVDPASYEVDAIACIELESRLPITLKVGKLVTTYKYEALPPDYTLSLPNEIASAIQMRAQQMQESTRRAVLP